MDQPVFSLKFPIQAWKSSCVSPACGGADDRQKTFRIRQRNVASVLLKAQQKTKYFRHWKHTRRPWQSFRERFPLWCPKIDLCLTRKRDSSLPSSSFQLPPLPAEVWQAQRPNDAFLLAKHPLLLSSASETVAPIKGQCTISPLKC